MEAYLMVINENIWLLVIYGDRNEFNAEAKEIFLKGISKLDIEKVRHYETIKEILERLQYMCG